MTANLASMARPKADGAGRLAALRFRFWGKAWRMQRSTVYLALPALFLITAGCHALHPPEVNYRTVADDTAHDSELAKKEHAKAAKILRNHFANEPADLHKAEQHLQKALVADVTYGPAHNSLGLVYYLQRKLYLAAWEFEYAAKLMPERIEPLYNLGLVYEYAERPDEAIEYYERALGCKPEDPILHGAMVRAQMRCGATLDEMRPQIRKILLIDTRPEWIAWAKAQLIEQPKESVEIEEFSAEMLPDAAAPKELLPPSDNVSEPTFPEMLPAPTPSDVMSVE